MKDELGGKFMTKFVGLRAKTYTYITNDSSQDKKVKGTKKGFRKRNLKFKNCKQCLVAPQLENKISHLEKNKINIKKVLKK